MGRVLCGLVLLVRLLPAQSVSFYSQPEVPAGSNPASFALGDFTGSGGADLAVVDRRGDALTVLRSLGNGFFDNFATQPLGSYPVFISTGDFNRDGILDVAVANYAGNSVSILLGVGNGSFLSYPSLSAKGPSSIAIGDFNRDGKLDLAIAETNSNTVSIWLGYGNGTFYKLFSSPVGQRPVSITTGDFNHDGKLDLAVANAGSNSASILLGNGNGTFLAPLDSAAGQVPSFVVAGDFNGDGRLDLAVTGTTGSSAGAVSVLLGLGNGAFQAPLAFPVGGGPSMLVAADLNGDGKLDLATANTASDTVSVLLGVGNGTFLPAQNLAVGSGPAWIGVADLNGDNRPDLVVANLYSDTLSVLINTTAVAGPIISGGGIVNAASFLGGPVAPGELITIFGSNLGSAAGVGTQVLFDGVPAILLYSSATQITAVVPYAVAAEASTNIELVSEGIASPVVTLPVTDFALGIFTLNSTGIGPAAIVNQGSNAFSVFLTGAGPIGQQPLPPVAITVGGEPANISFFGQAPAMASGIFQISVQVPFTLATGEIPIIITVGGNTTQPGVTLLVH